MAQEESESIATQISIVYVSKTKVRPRMLVPAGERDNPIRATLLLETRQMLSHPRHRSHKPKKRPTTTKKQLQDVFFFYFVPLTARHGWCSRGQCSRRVYYRCSQSLASHTGQQQR